MSVLVGGTWHRKRTVTFVRCQPIRPSTFKLLWPECFKEEMESELQPRRGLLMVWVIWSFSTRSLQLVSGKSFWKAIFLNLNRRGLMLS